MIYYVGLFVQAAVLAYAVSIQWWGLAAWCAVFCLYNLARIVTASRVSR